MRISARVLHCVRSFLTLFISVGVGLVVFNLLASNANAQYPSQPAQQQPEIDSRYLTPNVDPQVPKDTHTYAQVLVVDVLSAITCVLAGTDPVRPNQPCLGVNPQTGTLGFPETPGSNEFGAVQTNEPPKAGGVVGAMGDYIAVMYTPTISSSDYVEYLAGNFGIVKPAYAQAQLENCNTTANASFGYGYCGLNPIFNIWKLVRDLAYAIMVIAFVVLALGIMLRFKVDPRTVMTLQNQIPRVIIAILLITFSYGIAGFMIDLMWTVTYMGINAITAGSTAEACLNQDGGAAQPIANVAPLFLLDTPLAFTEHIFDVNCNGGFLGAVATGSSGLAEISENVSKGIGSALAELISSILGLGPIEEAGDNCGLFDPLECFGYIIGWIIRMVIKLIIIITLSIALFRIWFELLKTAVLFLVYTIGGPIWIVFGLIPGRPLGFEKWLRLLFAHLAAFPVVAFMLVFAAVLSKAYPEKPDPNSVFIPPLIGNPSVEGFGALLAFGLVLVTPAIPGMLREKMKVPPGKLGTQIRSSIGAGGAVVAAGYGVPMKRLTRRADHITGRRAGILRDWATGRIAQSNGKEKRWYHKTLGRLIDGQTPGDGKRR